MSRQRRDNLVANPMGLREAIRVICGVHTADVPDSSKGRATNPGSCVP